VTDRNLLPSKVGRGRLGCGVNEAFLTWKCGTPRFCGVLDTTEITYSRHLNDISEAQVVIPLSGNADDTCCDCLGDVEPWCHELHIARDGVDVWLGPVTEVVYEFDKVTIRALDILGWATVRVSEIILNYTTGAPGTTCTYNPQGPADWTTIAHEVLTVAFAEDDPCALDYITALPTGNVNSICFPPWIDTAFDQLDSMAQMSVLNYTVVGRTTVLFGTDEPAAPIATLTDDHILGTVQLTKTGLLQANRWFVHYDNDDTDTPPGPGMAERVQRYCYGLIERIRANIGLPYKENADQAAQDLLNATPNSTAPRLLEVPDGSRLSPETPWPISAMIPGVRVDVAITRLCVDATQSFLLTGMGVRQTKDGEEVTISLSPLSNPFTAP
jgi:hypothetical protein